MPRLSTATLTLPPADVDNDGNDETGVFVMSGDLTITLSTERNYVFRTGGTASSLTALVSEYYEGASGNQFGKGDGKRKQFFVDAGGGQHVVEVDFTGWEGSDNQWGNTGDASQLTAADATGEPAATQMQVLDRYLQVATISSASPAMLSFGEYSAEGVYDPIDVVIEQPTATFDPERGTSIYDGSLRFIEVGSFDAAIDAINRLE